MIESCRGIRICVTVSLFHCYGHHGPVLRSCLER